MATHTPSLDRRSLLRGTVTVAGAAVTLPVLGSLAGCSPTPASLEGFMPVVRNLADRIIPQTDTPGAIAAGVPDYVAAVFAEHFTADQRSDFVGGLEAIAGFAKADDLNLADPQDTDRLDAVLTKLAEGEAKDGATATWNQLRDMVIFGFYTSETATQELSYEEIPGRYVACLPLEEVGNAWLDRGV